MDLTVKLVDSVVLHRTGLKHGTLKPTLCWLSMLVTGESACMTSIRRHRKDQ